jgi:putative acyl-CoA dehydrogenase
MASTHDVTNQPPPLHGHDAAQDAALLEGLDREGAGWYAPDLHRLGRRAGTPQAIEWGFQANDNEPLLKTHDRYGHRIDEVDFHPSWHALMDVAVSEGLAAPWTGAPGAQVARAAGFYTWSQVEGGHGCPISMTSAVVPALRMQPDLAAVYEPLLQSRTYDPGLRTPTTKAGLLAGMGMTEKQGGSDVRANTTSAVRSGDTWRITGHKWFTSAPMCDLFLVLAQAPGGLSCFLVPRILPDGTRNTFRIQRLKDKLGNRSNASSEPEFDNTVAWLVGEEGRGVRTIIEMVGMTRLDCVIGSAALMRQALVQAIHHTTYRSAFGGVLRDKPAMQNVLADLALESEAATTLMMRLAGSVDRQEQAFKRLAVAVGKYWVTKRAPVFAGEALECLGGNGYVEESGMPRLYREAPLNSVWEGSGNVNALDVLRAMAREPESVEAYFAEVELADDARITAAVSDLQKDLGEADEVSARRLVEKLAMTLQASLLVRHAPDYVSDAYVTSRIEGDWGSAFGTLPRGLGLSAIVDRAAVHPPTG